MTAPSTFTALRQDPRPLLWTNAWDVAASILPQAAGAQAIGTTSFGLTAAMGHRDGFRGAQDATMTLGTVLAARLTVPSVIVDLEDGFSDAPAYVA